jgi:isopentenyldiphosphate isomerase
MSFLDHIRACNQHDISRFRPFRVASQIAGWIHDDFIATLARRADLFLIQPHAVTLNRELATAQQRTKALEPFLRELKEEGLIKGWRDERYPVSPRWTDEPLMSMERAAIPFFGVRAYGVHLTGFTRRKDGLHIWVATRSRTKPTYPGMLDNTVAGGQPEGISLADNIVKECKEEASIPEAMARQARPIGIVTYCLEHKGGLKPDVLFNYDLELPQDFVPKPHDDEIEHFELWPVQRVIERVRDTFDFKFNCNLVLIDFFIRHGLIDPEEPDYVEIAAGLHAYADGPRP